MGDQCIVCQTIDGKIPAKKVYEDDEVLAILDFNGANIGHTFVIPKEHIPILEQIPSHLIGKLFNVSNKVSSAIFEALGVQGTNIFVTNGITAGAVDNYCSNNPSVDLQIKLIDAEQASATYRNATSQCVELDQRNNSRQSFHRTL